MKDVLFLLHYETPGENNEPKRLAMLYDYPLFEIDPQGLMPAAGNHLPSLQAALDDPRWKNWTWVFFDADPACDPLSTFRHPRDKAVYVFGSDTDGWDRDLDGLPGALVRVDTAPSTPEEHTAALMAEVVIVHRYYQVDA